MKRIEDKIFDEERALYGSRGVEAVGCRFDGPADGESAFKECRDITARDCYFNLRYPFWHDTNVVIERAEMTELCRAALWYSTGVKLADSRLHGVKALRECANVEITHCDVVSTEFGWSSRYVAVTDSTLAGEYFMLRGEELRFENVKLTGKYSFQYIKNAVFENCVLDTKDTFWHAENVTLRNCTVKGAYLAWYSKHLRMEGCVIVGTQPFCYCEGLELVNCEMRETDLSFERSEVEATLTAPIDSIKNPRAGRITVPAIGELIMDDPDARGEIVVTG